MSETLYRYPGAQPFRDDDFSRRTFFGREPASIALADQILANRLVVVYAKSGLGKTSLLNAGVAPRLREAACVPLFVRVNDIRRGPLVSVLEGIRAEAERQHIEFVPGKPVSLWSFFKTVEFWRDDLLLTPILILDQFEELFTLQGDKARDSFLAELSYLVRGIPPPSIEQNDPTAGDTPPSVRLVLSLREDFLGLLEEASDRIPQIMDHRFRLAPLDCDTAAKAITGPAAIEDPNLTTKPFRLESDFVTAVLKYLTGPTATARNRGSRYVEPFHLQLICQRIEKIVALKQKVSNEEIVFCFKDLGGEAVFAQTLEGFYADAIASVRARHLQGAVRRLCEEFLISPEGRRLSLEERELQRQLKLPLETLRQLVDRRLLRTDRRSDSTYYELSHDALVQPVLASRRTQALVVGWTGVIGGSIIAFVCGLSALTLSVGMATAAPKDWGTDFVILFFLLSMVGATALGVAWRRAGVRRRKRYSRHASEFTQPLPTLLPLRDRMLGWVGLLAGITLLGMWSLWALYHLIIHVTVPFTSGKFPGWLVWFAGDDASAAWKLMYDHPWVEILWMITEYSAIIALGWMLIRQSARMLWPHRFAVRSKSSSVPGLDQPPSFLLAFIKVLCGLVALAVAGLGFYTLGECRYSWHGSVPKWLSGTLTSYRLSDTCQTLDKKGWDWSGVSFALFFCSALGFSISLLRQGVPDLRSVFGHLRFRRLHQEQLTAFREKLLAAASGVLLLVVLLYWAWSRSHSGEPFDEFLSLRTKTSVTLPSLWAVGRGGTILHSADGGRTWAEEMSGVHVQLNEVAFATPQSGWAVGYEGTILHTEDGGPHWAPQSSGFEGSLSVVSFATPQSGWAVGDSGMILHTSNAGRTWTPQPTGVNAYISAVAFANPQSGWAVGNAGTILHTGDGNTWTPQKSGTTANLNMAAFTSPQSGWAVGADGTILNTDNGGESWAVRDSGTVRYLHSVVFPTPKSGWIVGEKGIVLHTTDGGRTWKPQNSGVRTDLEEVVFATPQSGWAVGSGGTIVHTGDGGNTWTTQPSGVLTDLQSVAIARP